MKNNQFLVVVAMMALGAFFILNSCNKDEIKGEVIQVAGVEFIPNYFISNDAIVGIDADISAKAMQNAGLEFELNMFDSWVSAYEATLNGTNRALLTIAYTPERKDLFKWAGPTSQSMFGIFENGNSGHVFPVPLEDCKLLPKIAVVRHWMETTTLEENGFTNLQYYNTFNEALAAFMGGEVKYIASDFFHLVSSLPSGFFMDNVSTVTRYRTVYNYIAFSKDVSDAVVAHV